MKVATVKAQKIYLFEQSLLLERKRFYFIMTQMLNEITTQSELEEILIDALNGNPGTTMFLLSSKPSEEIFGCVEDFLPSPSLHKSDEQDL